VVGVYLSIGQASQCTSGGGGSTGMYCSRLSKSKRRIDVLTKRLKWRPMPEKIAGKLVASARNQW